MTSLGISNIKNLKIWNKFIADKLKTSDNENKNNLELINIFTKQSKIRYNSDEIPLKKTVAINRDSSKR